MHRVYPLRTTIFTPKMLCEAHIEGLHGNMRHFVVDSLHYGSQAVLWSVTKQKNKEMNHESPAKVQSDLKTTSRV